jgi:hypothetical protein
LGAKSIIIFKLKRNVPEWSMDRGKKTRRSGDGMTRGEGGER